MQLTVKNGKRIIRATKPELKALQAGLNALESYCACDPKDEWAGEAVNEIRRIIKRVSDESESEVGQGEAVGT